jgi:2-methylcitrate dehydratase PrpD
MSPSLDESGAGLTALARFAAGTGVRDLPGEVVRQAQACLLYGLSVGMASVRAEAPHMAATALDWGGDAAPDGATRLLDGKRVPVGSAAFANGVLLHSRVQEDAHPAGHIGVVVVSAALAAAERLQTSGADLLCALVSGYETALRIGRDHAADASARGFRTTSIYGAFGAAAATARLMRLSDEQTRDALALAASAACGLREFVNAGTEEFPLHAGYAARNGVDAAACARAGLAAAASSLEGSAGFFRSYAEPGEGYARRLSEGLGEVFEFREVTYKPYPTCQFNRSVVRGVLELRRQVVPERLVGMTISMHPFEADFFGVRYAGPFRQFSQTFMSAPFCAALAWETGRVGYDGLHRYDDAQVLASIARIEIVSDPNVARYQPRIVIQYGDGRTLAWQETQGSGAFRMTWEAAESMAGELGDEAGVSPQAMRELVGAVDALVQAPDVSALVETAARAVAAARRG